MLGISLTEAGNAFSFGGVGGRTAEVDMMLVCCLGRTGKVSFKV